METREVGSKNWFQEILVPTTSTPINSTNKEISDLFNDKKNEGNAHLAYNMVTDDADVCYIYRRKEADISAEKSFKQLCSLAEIIWLKYSDKIMPFMSEYNLEEISKYKIFSQISDDLLVDTPVRDAFFASFNLEFEADKTEFISKINEIKLMNLEESDRARLTKEICKQFGDNFLDKIIPDESANKDSSEESGNNYTNRDICGDIASHISKVIFFKMPLKFDAKDIKNAGDKLRDGRVYQLPHGSHNWLNNLSWLLAHIHKGNSFVIFSDLTENSLLRKSSGHENDLSGFAREIALLTKLKYQFHLEGSTLILLPSVNIDEIENLHVKDAYISDDKEVIKYYNQAIETCSKLMVTKNQAINSPSDILQQKITDSFLNDNTTSIFEQNNEKIQSTSPSTTSINQPAQSSTSSISIELSDGNKKAAITSLSQKSDSGLLTKQKKRSSTQDSNENRQDDSESDKSQKKQKQIHDATSDEEQSENIGNQSFLTGKK